MSKSKGPRYSGVTMVCPYFAREEAVSVSCQAKSKGMRVRLTFADKTRKKAWTQNYCETYEYWKCPLCEMEDEEGE